MSGSKRVEIGGLIILIGFVLIAAGAVASNVLALGGGSLLFLGGLVSVLWGTYASAVSWRKFWTRPSSQAARIWAGSAPVAHSLPYLPPPPPLLDPMRKQSQSPSAVGSIPARVAPVNVSGPALYAVIYLERGSEKRALFPSYESALRFRQVMVSAQGLYGVTPHGDVRIDDPPGARDNPATLPGPRPARFAVERAPEFLRVAEFIDQYRPSRRFERELFLQIELAEALRGKFGREAVRTELPIPGGGRVDIDVSGVGVELKIAASTQALRDLPSQLASYREHYGPNLVAVVFDDTGDARAISVTREAVRDLGVRMAVIRHR